MAKNKFDVAGKLVVIAGGSRGLGKAMALELAAKGANILLLARTHASLLVARQDVQAACQSPKQIVDAIPIDLTKPDQISELLSRYHTPDILICTAGHNHNHQPQAQRRFLADIPASSIAETLESTFYTTIYIVQCCLKRWREADVVFHPPSSSPTPTPTRHIILTSSIAALGGIEGGGGVGDGSAVYAAAKAAIRSLADTLRQELLLYEGGDAYRVHVSFPGRVLPDGQQAVLPAGAKISVMEFLGGSDERMSFQEEKDAEGGGGGRVIPDAGATARKILRGVEEGRTYIPVSFWGELLLNGMRGTSPRFWTLYELFLGLVAVVVGWLFRVGWDRRMRRYGRQQGEYGVEG